MKESVNNFLNSGFVKWCQTPWFNGIDNDQFVAACLLGVTFLAIGWLAIVKKVEFF